jgi:hypothetical protein
MATYQYNGDEVRVFPTLGLTLKSGDTFDSTEEVISVDVTLASTSKKSAPVSEPKSEPTPEPSAAPDTTQGA